MRDDIALPSRQAARMLQAIVLVMLVLATSLPSPASVYCAVQGREPYAERTFFGYACRGDCAAQKAGFDWAVRHGVSEPAVCAVLEAEMADGCRAFAQERLTPEEAGHAWALENEIGEPCLCDGGGPGFRAGCERQVEDR